MTERTICVVTGSRAEYGHLFWLLREIEDDPDLQLRLVVT
ncbi:MAG: UDP-N-acetylglucosamine 2-epimerase (hydrolyzing), partial [Proteobacteria bacterium]|nr:UDP-N-acetylglucosamine 2-epimerase (hydrolyzing) [Pseudomonadota bacterium]